MTIRDLLEYIFSYGSTNDPLDYEIVIYDEGDTYGLEKRMLEMQETTPGVDETNSVFLSINL